MTGDVTSPTFVISRVHRGPLPLVHVDAYRLHDFEVDDLDLDASRGRLGDRGRMGPRHGRTLADSYLEVLISRRDDDSREVELVAHRGDWADRVASLLAQA